MNKVICDICGTAYPETADRCPICGSPRQIDSRMIPDTDNANAATTARRATRGGHFSNANVRKRMRANQTNQQRKHPNRKQNPSRQKESGQAKAGKGAVVTAWVLLIAVLAVLCYIVVRFAIPMFTNEHRDDTQPQKPADSTAAPVEDEKTSAQQQNLACTALIVSDDTISLDAVGRAWLLEVKTEPANTTDPVLFSSSDDTVATVTEQGRVTAVGSGRAVITIACGDLTEQCVVICDFDGSGDLPQVPDISAAGDTSLPEDTTSAAVPPDEIDGGGLKLSVPDGDATIAVGESFDLYLLNGEGNTVSVDWQTESAYVEISGNTVTGIAASGDGYAEVFCVYNGETFTCIVRVRDAETED